MNSAELYSFPTILAVLLVSPVSVENSKELRLLLDEGENFRYLKRQFFDMPHMVEFKKSISKSGLLNNSVVSSFSEARLYSAEMQKDQRCLLFIQRNGFVIYKMKSEEFEQEVHGEEESLCIYDSFENKIYIVEDTNPSHILCKSLSA